MYNETIVTKTVTVPVFQEHETFRDLLDGAGVVGWGRRTFRSLLYRNNLTIDSTLGEAWRLKEPTRMMKEFLIGDRGVVFPKFGLEHPDGYIIFYLGAGKANHILPLDPPGYY